ncbi:MAG: 4Fe-4S cluster-binding domain-containing protein, partial [Clostridiales Family XIII bacterium]|nr:4Fe-4S cluster-binding domain-containing protein [Clostridiales Family XIII bacterium]
MIHLYQFKNQNILLDVNSGAVHAVSGIVFDLLSRFTRESEAAGGCPERVVWERRKQSISEAVCAAGDVRSADAVKEAMAEIDALAESGMLFAGDIAPEDVSPERRGAVIKAMCLHVAHDCNMRCAYCFGDEGAFLGERALLSEETGAKAIDFLLAHSGDRRNLEIDFFGGEPLMNFDVVRALVRYGRERER